MFDHPTIRRASDSVKRQRGYFFRSADRLRALAALSTAARAKSTSSNLSVVALVPLDEVERLTSSKLFERRLRNALIVASSACTPEQWYERKLGGLEPGRLRAAGRITHLAMAARILPALGNRRLAPRSSSTLHHEQPEHRLTDTRRSSASTCESSFLPASSLPITLSTSWSSARAAGDSRFTFCNDLASARHSCP